MLLNIAFAIVGVIVGYACRAWIGKKIEVYKK